MQTQYKSGHKTYKNILLNVKNKIKFIRYLRRIHVYVC